MPHATKDDYIDFKLIQVKELHPTFGAEVDGVDFSKPVPDEVFSEIHKAIIKVNAAFIYSAFTKLIKVSRCLYHDCHASTTIHVSLTTHPLLTVV